MKSCACILCLIIACVSITCKRSADPDHTSLEWLERGMSELDSDSLVAAFNSFLTAKTLASKEGNQEGEFEASVYLALLYEYMGHTDSAYIQLKRLPYREIKDDNSDPRSRHYSTQYFLRLMGLYAFKVDKDYDTALDYYDRAIELSKKLYPDDTIYVYTDLANQADIFRAKGDSQKAWEIVEFLEQAPKLKYGMYLSQAHYVKGWLFYEIGDLESAYDVWEEDEAYCEDNNMHENHLTELVMLSRIDSLRRDIDNYFTHNSRYHQLYQQLRGYETNFQVAIMQEQNKMLIEREAHARQRTIFWLGAALLLAIILGLLALLAYLRKAAITRHKLAVLEKEQLDSQLERQRLERELAELRMHQSQAELERANKDNLALSLQIAEMPEDAERDKYLQAFEQQLRSTDSQLFDKLQRLYPQLTRNDLRLIGMIRLGMSPLEMRNLLNITADSLKKNRYRLRKKLGLSTDQNLEEFFDALKNSSDEAV